MIGLLDLLNPAIKRPKPVLELFLRLGPDDLAAIRSAGTAEALHQAAHKLKGTASILGLERLAAACRELDDVARSGDLESGRALIDGIARAFEATCEALRAELVR